MRPSRRRREHQRDGTEDETDDRALAVGDERDDRADDVEAGDGKGGRDAPPGVAGEAEGRHKPGHAQHEDSDGEDDVRLRVGPEGVADVDQRDQGEREDREDADELHGGLLTVVSGGLVPPYVSMTLMLAPTFPAARAGYHEAVPRVRENVPTNGSRIPLRVQRGQVRV